MLIPLKLPPFPIHRTIRPGHRERFACESTWDGAGNTATYRYDFVLQFSAYSEKEDLQAYEATFRAMNLRVEQNGVVSPRVALGAVIGVKLRPSGSVEGLRISGPAATIGLPLLGWFVPDSLSAITEYRIHTEIDLGLVADGWARVESVRRGNLELKFDLAIGPESMPEADRKVRFTATSNIQIRTGQILKVEGAVVDPNGTLNFRILN